MQERVGTIRVDESVIDYMLAIVEKTRSHEGLELGVSPRGSQALYKAAQALAMIEGRRFATPDDVKRVPASITGKYLAGVERIEVPAERRQATSWVKLTGAREHNLRNVTVEIPLGVMVAVTGVSGAGKSSLINATLFPALNRMLHRSMDRVGPYDSLTGLGKIDKCIVIDQQPIGRTPRSNPATYTKAFDLIREMYAQVPQARTYGYQAGRSGNLYKEPYDTWRVSVTMKWPLFDGLRSSGKRAQNNP